MWPSLRKNFVVSLVSPISWYAMLYMSTMWAWPCGWVGWISYPLKAGPLWPLFLWHEVFNMWFGDGAFQVACPLPECLNFKSIQQSDIISNILTWCRSYAIIFVFSLVNPKFKCQWSGQATWKAWYWIFLGVECGGCMGINVLAQAWGKVLCN